MYKGNKYISPAIIKRLPRYYRFLGELKSEGVERISSSELSKMMNATASQIRQDLNNFGGFGQQGYGYNVEYLYNEIGKILHLNKPHNMVMIGAGNLGSAICGYKTFPRYGFNILAVFDVDPNKIGSHIHDIEVHSMDELETFLDENAVEIVIVAIPTDNAFDVMKRLEKTHIKGVWNFAHIDYEMPNGIAVESVHLSESLMILNYKIANNDKTID
ncbi:MAG: redox-sensing transcriptional repressor Rex [Lachnospiraceae bacterium]|nr:redox-sensing transcriptional repressor Rex [Lachnospiraceae bacterium]